jgi:uncharacterized protein (TIGR03083 family)
MIDTRSLFRPLSNELIALLRRLAADDWQRRTIAGAWLVRDVAAHLADLMLRRVSFHRDRHTPPPPARAISSERDFVAFINDVNAEWVSASKRLSPHVLTSLVDLAAHDLADWFEALPLDAPALFGVSWAGEQTSEGWFDVGREYAELWHHQQQIRLAVGAPLLVDPRFLGPALEIAVRGVPHAFRDAAAEPGTRVVIDVTGPASRTWTLTRDGDRWTLASGAAPQPAATIRLADDVAWRLFFHAIAPDDAARAIEVTGRRDLAVLLLRARAVVV